MKNRKPKKFLTRNDCLINHLALKTTAQNPDFGDGNYNKQVHKKCG
jgi:hypothetical protein